MILVAQRAVKQPVIKVEGSKKLQLSNPDVLASKEKQKVSLFSLKEAILEPRGQKFGISSIRILGPLSLIKFEINFCFLHFSVNLTKRSFDQRVL